VGAGLEKERPGGPEDWLIRRHESIEYGVMSIGCGNVSGGGPRWRVAGKTSSGLRSRQSGARCGLSGAGAGAGAGLNQYLNLNT
jgi:hypothetical protein